MTNSKRKVRRLRKATMRNLADKGTKKVEIE